jgi:hypothetical protein
MGPFNPNMINEIETFHLSLFKIEMESSNTDKIPCDSCTAPFYTEKPPNYKLKLPKLTESTANSNNPPVETSLSPQLLNKFQVLPCNAEHAET